MFLHVSCGFLGAGFFGQVSDFLSSKIISDFAEHLVLDTKHKNYKTV